MAQSTVTDKGQTTVPQEIREALGIMPRQQLTWTLRNDGTALVRPQASALGLYGSLRPAKPFPGIEMERKAMQRAIGKQAAKEGIE